jgi:hypothetical protein
VPPHIREQWKRVDEDTSVLLEMSNVTGYNFHGVNTLLVVDKQGRPILHVSSGLKTTNDEDDNDDDNKWIHFLDNASPVG